MDFITTVGASIICAVLGICPGADHGCENQQSQSQTVGSSENADYSVTDNGENCDNPGGGIDVGDDDNPGDNDGGSNSSGSQAIADGILAASNKERSRAGLPLFKTDPKLHTIAQRWTERMSSEDRMYHNPALDRDMNKYFSGAWSSYGENVLQNWDNQSGADLVRQWMNSPPHRKNMMNGQFTHLGVGVAVDSRGKLYATQNFATLGR